ncbi:MAG: GNAT family N-acetyltransferase [Bacteroidetes bacterium]|nr:GNAT family N-acetyltransferase [Bacteroidota bacterium]
MIALLDKQHNRREFDCGKEMLNSYIQYQASQDVKRKLSACFVLKDNQSGLIQGYYTLSNNSIPLDLFPAEIQKRLPQSYTSIPVTLLGRLAIDKRFQGKGIGKILLIDALKRSYGLSNTIGSFAVMVDPIDMEAELFYEKFGFIKLPDSGKMFIAMQTLKALFDQNG